MAASCQKLVTIPAIVQVSWWDAHSIDEWTDLDDLETDSELCLCESVGFLLLEKPDRIVLSNTIDPAAKDACCVVVIPRAMLADAIKILRPAEEVVD